MSTVDHAFAVILAGGGGTRLWPKSRNKTPKQFLKLTGQKTMMQIAVARVTQLVPWDHVIVVTNQSYIDDIKQQLPQIPSQNIIAEPQRRETALAMLVGALYAQSLDPNALVLNCASDHVVIEEDEYVKVMKAALEVAAQKQYLISVGINPSYPTSAFGYIKVGRELGQADGSTYYKVDNFTEKPDVETAQKFIDTGKYYWNANMYVWAVETLLAAFKQHQPHIFELTQHLSQLNPQEFHAALPAIYDKAESISIDYAISEKVDNLVLIPGQFGWNDVGDWRVVYELGNKDADGNVVIGDSDNIHTLAIKSQNNMVQTNDRLVALYGINDMIIIDTPEILMIAPKEKSQEVKKLVEHLKEHDQKEYL